MAKLVAIGDSLTQGVISGAISKTKLSYPALIAKAMGLTVWQPGDDVDPKDPNVFRVPHFPGSGLPLNIEELLRAIGPDFDGTMDDEELKFRVSSILKFINKHKNSYGLDKVDGEVIYHNLAVLSFRVFDSFTINSTHYDQYIGESEKDINKCFRGWELMLSALHEAPAVATNILKFLKVISREASDVLSEETPVFVREMLFLCLNYLSDILDRPSETMYGIARYVLNPNQNPDRDSWTQIRNLRHIMDTDSEGVKNLILFLGANDCLGTVRDREIEDMTERGVSDDLDDPEKRRRYNLTSTNVFREDYTKMVRQISEIISEDTKVFVGTIPHVTIPPLTQASNEIDSEHEGYFTYYAPFFASPSQEDSRSGTLTGEEAKFIDDRIDKFNKIIKCVIQTVPNPKNWHLVDICCLLDKLAVKRKGKEGDPSQPVKQLFPSGHALLDNELGPVPNVLRFHTENNERKNGGIFSLDCFHPTTIGYGLIARAFICAMRKAGVCHVQSGSCDWGLDWEKIIKKDTLIQKPPVLWDDAINVIKEHSALARVIDCLLT